MLADEYPPAFESSIRFDVKRIRAAAVSCSDGRFGEQCDDFLHNGLQLPRYDRLAVPGGAACLAGHFAAYREEQAAIEELRFLVEVHGLEQVILIAHDNCAFYRERLAVLPFELESRQTEDNDLNFGRPSWDVSTDCSSSALCVVLVS